MGLLKLLTFPVSGPVSGGRCVLQTLLDEAERRYYDTNAIQDQLAQVERQHRAGEIDDATFDATEESLLQRLIDAQAYHRRRAEEERSPP
jgi:hypothetical protein